MYVKTAVVSSFVMFLLPAWPAQFTVNSTHDAGDANPGDGICATATGECTLRAAIQETNALPGPNEIFVPGAIYQLTIPGMNEDCAATGDLDVTNDVTIRGAGPAATIVDAAGLDRVFQVLPSQPQCNTPGPAVPHVTIRGMTVRNGSVISTGDSGGGIFSGIVNKPGGVLDLIDVAVSGSAAVFGGGIMNGWGASVSLTGVTVSGNSASYGGGLYTRDTGKVQITNSTFSGNSASAGGGGIDTWYLSELALEAVTIANNTAAFGAGINDEFNTHVVTSMDTIIAENSGGDCVGAIVSLGYNLDSDNTCVFARTTDLPGRNPKLGPLQDNGGPTPTLALLEGSPAINQGGTRATGCKPVDQRYLLRAIGEACDIGAFEAAVPASH